MQEKTYICCENLPQEALDRADILVEEGIQTREEANAQLESIAEEKQADLDWMQERFNLTDLDMAQARIAEMAYTIRGLEAMLESEREDAKRWAAIAKAKSHD